MPVGLLNFAIRRSVKASVFPLNCSTNQAVPTLASANENDLPSAFSKTSLIASLPLRANKARSSYFALDCVAKSRANFVVRPNSVILDRVRLALPRSPESGVAVSTPAIFLSRKKHKI